MKLLKNLFLVLTSSTLFFFNSNGITEAGIIKGYIPPSTGFFLQRTESSGTRGRCPVQDTYIKLIAPNDHIATTTLPRPSFLAYISQSKLPVRFALVEIGKETALVDEQIKLSKAGITKFDLPKEVNLFVNKRYRWTVSLVCNKKNPSANPYATAVMERVEIPLQLKQKLEGASEVEKASLYEERSIWYDALNSRFKERTKDKINGEEFLKLLKHSGLSEELAKRILNFQ